MAKKALINKQQRKPKFKVRAYTRCRRCGRPHAVYRKFGLCRVCLREMAHAGELPGELASFVERGPQLAEPVNTFFDDILVMADDPDLRAARLGHLAVAGPGAVMPDGTRLKKAKLRGVESNGMILAEDELAIGPDHERTVLRPQRRSRDGRPRSPRPVSPPPRGGRRPCRSPHLQGGHERFRGFPRCGGG